MPVHITFPEKRSPLHLERYANNGMAPSATSCRSIASRFNQIACWQKKNFLLMAQPLNNVSGGALFAYDIWHTAVHTGEGTTAINILAGMSLTDAGATSTPSVTFYALTTGGATAAEKTTYFHGLKSSGTVTPNEISHISTLLTGLSANTEYRIRMATDSGMRLVYASCSESYQQYADDNTANISSPGNFVGEGPIYSTHWQDLIGANNALWRHNAHPLFSFTQPYIDSTAPTVTATSWTNVLDGSSTSVTASTPGYKLYTTYDGATSRSTAIPVKLVVRTARVSGAANLDLRVTDGTNAVTISGITSSDQWSSTTATIPAQSGTKWDIQGQCTTNGSVYRVKAVCLMEYEA